MAKISPIAAYLTANKAVSVRNGNVWRFYSKEGCYLGKQIMEERGNLTVYNREVVGEGLKRLFYECKIIGQNAIYFINEKSPIGISVLPVQSYIQNYFFDYLANTVRITQIEKNLTNNKIVRAMERNLNVGIYEIEGPLRYSEKICSDDIKTMEKRIKIKHNIH